MSILLRLSSDIQYYGTSAMIRLIRSIPYGAAIALGRAVMLLIWAFMPLRRRIVKIQMRSALGLKNTWRIVMKVFMNQGDILVDTIKYAYMSDDEIRARIVVEGKEHLEEALSSGKGLMLFTGHIGNWEILSNFTRLLHTQFCIMADLRKDLRLESIVNEIRSRCGATILPPKGKALMLIKELRKGRTIGIVVDQRGRRSDGLLCNIFGLPAPTNPAPAFIALKGNALVMPVYTVKIDGTHYIRIEEAVDSARFGQGHDAIGPLSDYMQSFVASVVQKYPDQWFWLHSRWIRRRDFKKIRTDHAFRDLVLVEASRIKEAS